jgi:hypothetical protein
MLERVPWKIYLVRTLDFEVLGLEVNVIVAMLPFKRGPLLRIDPTEPGQGGRGCRWSLRNPSSHVVTAQQVEALVGPSPGSCPRVRVKLASSTPAASPSRMFPSMLVMTSVMLTQMEVVVLQQMFTSLGQNCLAKRNPLNWVTEAGIQKINVRNRCSTYISSRLFWESTQEVTLSFWRQCVIHEKG